MVFAETTPCRAADSTVDNQPPASITRTLESKPAAPEALRPLQLPSLRELARLPVLHTSADTALMSQLDQLRDEIERRMGGKIVFSRQELSEGSYYDSLPPLSLERQVRAAEIAARELRKYPSGFFEKLGLKTFGIFEACISNTNDGFHAYDQRYGGYRWYGLYNFKHGAIGAYYSDAQLPLTIHHELFHAVDAHERGAKAMLHYESDNARFVAATTGQKTYPALALPPAVLRELKTVARGIALQDAVSDYTTKSPDEDQAETARHFMMNIADSLIQAAERPSLPGSQRILHILEQYRTCVKDGPDAFWFAAVALGRSLPQTTLAQEKTSPPRLPTEPIDPNVLVRSLLETITNEKGAFIVRGEAVDDYTPNLTLQEDVRSFGTNAKALVAIQKETKGRYSAEGDLRELLGLLEAYEGFLNLNYKVSRETRRVFRETREEVLSCLPEKPRGELRQRLLNPHYLGKVDRALHSSFAHKPNIKEITKNIREAQPAVVLINRASGFNINPDGTILTNAHVTHQVGKTMRAQFPNGDIFEGECTHIDEESDLALVKLKGVNKPLPFVRFSREEAPVGSEIVLIGQPDTYDQWHVSTGRILNYHPHPHTAVDGYPLGGTEHNGWTFWGNSGSPILNLAGLVVGTHNTYDDKRNMRCGVRYQPTIEFLKKAKAVFEFGR